VGVSVFGCVDSSFGGAWLTGSGGLGKRVLRAGRRAFLFLHVTLMLSLIDANRLIQEKREGGGSSDVGNGIFDSGLETFMEQETFGIVIEVQRVDERLELGSVGGGRFGLDEVREFILVPGS
jgi:hypothetical protein